MGEATLLMMGTWMLTGLLCTFGFILTTGHLVKEYQPHRFFQVLLGIATLSFWVGLIVPNYM